MLSEAKVDEVEGLLARREAGEGISLAEIARRTGVSRGTVGEIFHGRRPDYSAIRHKQRTRDRSPFDTRGAETRCSLCGAIVQIPCQTCEARRRRARGGPRPVDDRGCEADLALDLKPAHRRRYEALHRGKLEAGEG